MIKITDKWVVNADERQWIAGKLYVDKKGNESIQSPTYHATLSKALESVLKALQREDISNHTYTLKEAVQALQSAQNAFTDRLAELGITEDIT